MLPPCSPPQDQKTPLHAAAYNNSVDAAKVLIDRGAQVDARTSVSLNPRTLGEKAQGTWQLGPGMRVDLCVFRSCWRARKKEKKKKSRVFVKRQVGLGFSV